MKKNCLDCGATFQTKAHNAKRCSKCRKENETERNRRYYKENKEKVAEQKRRYYKENKEKVAEQKRRYYEENKEKIAEYQKDYRKQNREKVSAYFHRYREENRDKIAKKGRSYYANNKEQKAEYKRRYYARHKRIKSSKAPIAEIARKETMHKPPQVFAVVDLETTGLPETDYRTGASDFGKQKGADHPVHITELSAIVYAAGMQVASFETPVQLPEGVTIPDAVVDLNGLTAEFCNDKGMPILEAVNEFENILIHNHCKTIVGHNAHAFDAPLLARHTSLAGYYTIHDTKLVAAAWMNGKQCGAHENLGHFYGRVGTLKPSKATSLENLFHVFVNAEATQTHRALLDCIMTRQVLEQFIERGIWANVFATA